MDSNSAPKSKPKPNPDPHPSKNTPGHQIVHNRQDDESLLKFQCSAPDCTYKTSRKCTLKQHLRVHSDSRPFACDLCPYRAKQKPAVRSHKKSVHSREKPFKCPHLNCAYAAKTKEHLNTHQRGHSDARPFVCPFPECTYAAKRKRHLKIHETTHTGEKPFKCPFCPYSFVERSGLTIHLRVHTGEAPYPCKICAFRGKSSSALTQHVKRSHLGQKPRSKPTDEQPFTCSFQNCPYKSKMEHRLKEHEMAHRGEKPFQCTLCPYSAVIRCDLNVHIRKHTGETPYPCHLCSYRAKSRTLLTRHVKSVHLGRKRSSKNKTKDGNMSQVQRSKLKRCKVANCSFSTIDDSYLALHFNAAHNLPRVILQSNGTF